MKVGLGILILSAVVVTTTAAQADVQCQIVPKKPPVECSLETNLISLECNRS